MESRACRGFVDRGNRIVGIGRDNVALIARITGECRINGSDDARYRIRTGQAGVESSQYVWQGQRLGFASNPRQVFLGLPRLNCHTPEGVRQIARSEIEWRRAGSQQVLGSEFQVTGPVDAILRVDGEIVFRTRMVILDRTARLAFRSGQAGSQGVIEFQGDWGIQHLGMESTPASARVEALLAGWQVTIDSTATAPETVSFILDWERSVVPLRLPLPVPVSGGRFFKTTGEVVRNGDALAPRELIGSRLRILDSNPDRPMNYAIQLSLMVGHQQIAHGEMHRIQLIGNSAEVRLFDYQPEIESLLSGSDALDAFVELVLWVGNQPQQKISVKRYDCAFGPDSNGVALSQADIQQLSPEALRGIKVLGTRLHDFSQPAVELVQIESEGVPGGRWFPRNLVSDSGPIFVYPSPESCLQFRPMLLPGHSPDSDPPVVEEGLAAAVLRPDPDARSARHGSRTSRNGHRPSTSRLETGGINVARARASPFVQPRLLAPADRPPRCARGLCSSLLGRGAHRASDAMPSFQPRTRADLGGNTYLGMAQGLSRAKELLAGCSGLPILPSRCFPSMSTEKFRRSRASVRPVLFA